MSRPRRAAAVLLATFGAVLAAGCQSKKPKTSAEVLLTERMGQVLLRENRPAEAEKAFREVLKDDPKNPEVQDGLGLSLLMQGRFQEALPFLEMAVDLAPNNASYRNNRGVALMELGNFKDAAADFDAAERSVNPDDRVSATINRGRLLQRQGEYFAAEKAFTEALARDPQSFAAMFGRAAARESSGELEGAAEDYLAAIKINPESAEANLRLGALPRHARQARPRTPVPAAGRRPRPDGGDGRPGQAAAGEHQEGDLVGRGPRAAGRRPSS
jgi:tetratricopeptide (TPR) repeat protein